MAQEITATYTGTGITKPDAKGNFQLVAPVTKLIDEKGAKPTINKSNKLFPASAKSGAKVNADGSISITVTEGKRGRKQREILSGADALKALGL